MKKGANVRFAEELHRECAQVEQRKWAWLSSELSLGAEAAESEFVSLDAEVLLATAKKRKNSSSF